MTAARKVDKNVAGIKTNVWARVLRASGVTEAVRHG
jgi:hypothetical protein